MALLDVLALLDATSIYRGAIIRIGNAPATSDGPSRSSCLCLVIERDGVKLMTRCIVCCGSCWHSLWRSHLALRSCSARRRISVSEGRSHVFNIKIIDARKRPENIKA